MNDKVQRPLECFAPTQKQSGASDRPVRLNERAPGGIGFPAWTVEYAKNTYGISGWGEDFYSINADGSIQVTPQGKNNSGVSLKALTDQLTAKGVQFPMMLRFPQMLERRAAEIVDAFEKSSKVLGYSANYKAIYHKGKPDRFSTAYFYFFGYVQVGLGSWLQSRTRLRTGYGSQRSHYCL